MDKRKDPNAKVPCRQGCGKEFSPAGRAYHEKFCTGPGYEPIRRPNRSGRHDLAAVARKANLETIDGRFIKIICSKGCGREYTRAGMAQHEKYCEGPGYVPGYSWKRRAERKPQNPKAQEEAKYTGEKDMVYELFFDDAALYACVMHLLDARDDKSVLCNLEAAKTMIETKIRFLKS